MRKVQGSINVALLECVNPKRGKWRVRWDVTEQEDGNAIYMEEEFDHKPERDEIRTLIFQYYNSEVDATILSGFSYEEHEVWLSSENQFNYKAAYDLAVQTDGSNLPVTFKLGTDDAPYYRTFDNINDLKDFYTQVMQFIQATITNGWKKKDSVNLEAYESD